MDADYLQIACYVFIGVVSYIIGRYHQAIVTPKCVACDLWDMEHSK